MTRPFADYDARHYPTVDVVTGYGAWAPMYDRTHDGQLDVPLLATLKTVNWQAIQRAVDLACGTGRIGAWSHQQGIAHLHGVDRSPAMLQRAAAKQVYKLLGQADITQCPLPGHAYDLAVTVLAVCHLPDLQAFYTEVARLLRPGGFFVLVDYHPFFLLRGIPTHFDRAPGDPRLQEAARTQPG